MVYAFAMSMMGAEYIGHQQMLVSGKGVIKLNIENCYMMKYYKGTDTEMTENNFNKDLKKLIGSKEHPFILSKKIFELRK